MSKFTFLHRFVRNHAVNYFSARNFISINESMLLFEKFFDDIVKLRCYCIKYIYYMNIFIDFYFSRLLLLVAVNDAQRRRNDPMPI